MTEALQQEIRTLRSILDSARDPGGRVFAPLADAYRRAGRVPEALRMLNEGLAKHPDFVTGHVVAAQLYVEQGLGAEGQLAARRALELDGENVVALGALLRALEESGEAEAEEVRARLSLLEPEFAREDTRAREPEPAVVQAFHEPASPDAPTLELRALAGLAPTRSTAPETFELEAPPIEPTGPAGAIDLMMLAPLPGAALPSSALASEPEPAVMERGFDLSGLAADEAPVEDLISLDALAPESGGVGEPVFEEPVMDLSALAPEPALEEPVMDLSALAPEPVVDLGTLAPDEEVVSLDTLAPETVLDMHALAPGPEAMVRVTPPIQDLLGFDEPVFDLDTLAPTQRTAGGAQETPAVASPPVVEEAVDIAFLSPSRPDDIVIDLDALRPEASAPVPPVPAALPEASEAAAPAPVVTPSPAVPEAEAPDPVSEAPAPSEPESAATPEEQGEPVYTRTLAELYAAQGAVKQAIEVLRHLMVQNPSDEEIARRVAELEAGESQAPVDKGPVEDREEEVETLARELAESGAIRHEVESPFAWADMESEATAEVAGPTIREYFDGLLGWERREDA